MALTHLLKADCLVIVHGKLQVTFQLAVFMVFCGNDLRILGGSVGFTFLVAGITVAGDRKSEG